MLLCVEEINERKRFEATFSDGSTTKFGQTNPQTGTYIDHKNEKLKTNYIKGIYETCELMTINEQDTSRYFYCGTNQI